MWSRGRRCRGSAVGRRESFFVTGSLSIISDGKPAASGRNSAGGGTAADKTCGFVFAVPAARQTCGFAAPGRLVTPLSLRDISPKGENPYISSLMKYFSPLLGRWRRQQSEGFLADRQNKTIFLISLPLPSDCVCHLNFSFFILSVLKLF